MTLGLDLRRRPTWLARSRFWLVLLMIGAGACGPKAANSPENSLDAPAPSAPLSIAPASGATEPAVAAIGQPVLAGDITETFSDQVPTSGELVVGVAFASAAPKVAIDDLRIPVPEHLRNSALCFAATTRNGFYQADGMLRLSQPRSDHVRLGESRDWRFAEQLSEYDTSDFAARLRVGDDCLENPKAPFIPLAFSSSSDHLLVSLNTKNGEELSATLDILGTILDAVCTTESAARSTSFGATCAFDLTDSYAAGPATLMIRYRPSGAPPLSRTQSILLP